MALRPFRIKYLWHNIYNCRSMNLKYTISFLFICFFANKISAQDLNCDSLLARAIASQTNYKTISVKANLVWDDGNTAQQFNATIRNKKDSLIWMSLSLFGIEGARTLISPDSFRLINKMSAEYLVRPFDFIQNWISFPINFNMLQQIIAGEIISINPKATLALVEDSSYVLLQETDQLQQKIWLNTENYTVKKILLKDKLLKQSMAISFDAYNFSEAKPLAKKRTITITRDISVMTLSMDITKVRFNDDLQFPFEVSEKYKRIE